jgi:hypothetical protein
LRYCETIDSNAVPLPEARGGLSIANEPVITKNIKGYWR